MFTAGSRYAGVPVREMTVTDADGSTRTIRYAARRILPRLDSATALARHRVAPGERLDLLAARYLSDPTRFWLICDANPVVWPEELERQGCTFVVAMPGR